MFKLDGVARTTFYSNNYFQVTNLFLIHFLLNHTVSYDVYSKEYFKTRPGETYIVIYT